VTVHIAGGETIREIALYSGDMSRLALKATLTPLASPWVSTRVKLRETGDVIVNATTDDGRQLTGRKKVAVTGGAYPEDGPATDPRIKLRGKGDTVKMLMNSPMGSTSHIASVRVTSGGGPLVDAETTPWVAKNPYFAFRSAQDVGGRFEVEVALNNGERFAAQTDAAPPADAAALPRPPQAVPAASTGQPSFDCAKASSWSEVTVCNDAGLADLDRYVAELYRSKRRSLTGEQQESVIRDQRTWLRERERCEKQADRKGCLVGVYKARITELGGQPENSPRGGAAASSARGAGTVTTADGKTVSYGPSAKVAAFVEFQADTKGYRNTYTLDCENKRFLWTKNVLLATGQDTRNNAGAEWKRLTPESTLSNAVYEAACPQLLASVGKRKTAAAQSDGTNAANSEVWDYGVGLAGAAMVADPGNDGADQVATSGTADSAGARVDPAAEKSSTATGGGYSVPRMRALNLEASKLELPRLAVSMPWPRKMI
jgi:uncharacterized protein